MRVSAPGFHSQTIVIDKSIVWLSYATPFVVYIAHQFFNKYNGPKPELYCRYIGAIVSTREELNSFHPALKYTCEISDTSLAFLNIKVSVEGNGLSTGVH